VAPDGSKAEQHREPRNRWRFNLALFDERRYFAWLLLALVVAAVLAGAIGWNLYDRGSEPRVGSGFFNGDAAVYISASEQPTTQSFVSVTVTPTRKETSGDQHAIDVRLEMLASDFPTAARVRWAIALIGDAVLRLEPGAPTFGATARSDPVTRHGQLGADVEMLFATSRDRSVLVGTFRDKPRSSPATIWANVTIPLSRPFLLDSGEAYALSTPDFGAFEDRSVSQTGEIGGAAPRELDPSFLARLQGPDGWSLPTAQTFAFADIDRGGFQDFGTQPSRFDVRTWLSTAFEGAGEREFLKVDAMFTRPTEQEKRGRRLFLAGLLLSASASLGIWALELLFGPERTPLLRRRPTPRP